MIDELTQLQKDAFESADRCGRCGVILEGIREFAGKDGDCKDCEDTREYLEVLGEQIDRGLLPALIPAPAPAKVAVEAEEEEIEVSSPAA
jgi:hypothetical protein